MTIHVFINCYWNSGISGGDRRIIEILRRWKNTDDLSIVVYTTHRFADLLESEGIRHNVVLTETEDQEKRNIVVAYHDRTKRCKKLLLDRFSPGDILYSPTDIMPDVMPALFIKRKFKSSATWCMVTHHILESFYKRPGNIINNFLSCYQQRLTLAFAKRHADEVMTVSPIVYDRLGAWKFDVSRIERVDSAVDIDLLDGCNLDVKGYDAVFLARLNYSKGVLELPEIWKKVTEKKPDARLGIIGKGSEDFVAELKSKINEQGVSDSIDLLGFQPDDVAYSTLKKSKVFLFTSHEEGWGLVLMEALICNIPVVAYRLPVFPILFPKGTILCDFKNTDQMAEGVLSYLENEEKRVSDAREGKKHIIDRYSYDRLAQREMEIILSVSKRGKK